MTRISEGPSQDELENLFVNNDKLDRIGAYLNRFNPISIMRMEGKEIRHSAILAWLLDPQGTHGFGDQFLKAFLAQALSGQSGAGSPTALEVSLSDLRDAEIRREWKNIDIFIFSRSRNWAFVIENKFHSKQREGQIKGYIEKVKNDFDYKEYRVWGILLTLTGEDPEDANQGDLQIAALSYIDICAFLPHLIELEGQSMGQEVKVFLKHYLEVIEGETGMSKEQDDMEKLAGQLYRTHRKVLDFVMEHGARNEFVAAAKMVFKNDWERGRPVQVDGEESYIYMTNNSIQFEFLPKIWKDALESIQHPMGGCENYGGGYPLACWFRLSEGKGGINNGLQLVAELGPIADHRLRKDFIVPSRVQTFVFQTNSLQRFANVCIPTPPKMRPAEGGRVSFSEGWV